MRSRRSSPSASPVVRTSRVESPRSAALARTASIRSAKSGSGSTPSRRARAPSVCHTMTRTPGMRRMTSTRARLPNRQLLGRDLRRTSGESTWTAITATIATTRPISTQPRRPRPVALMRPPMAASPDRTPVGRSLATARRRSRRERTDDRGRTARANHRPILPGADPFERRNSDEARSRAGVRSRAVRYRRASGAKVEICRLRPRGVGLGCTPRADRTGSVRPDPRHRLRPTVRLPPG